MSPVKCDACKTTTEPYFVIGLNQKWFLGVVAIKICYLFTSQKKYWCIISMPFSSWKATFISKILLCQWITPYSQLHKFSLTKHQLKMRVLNPLQIKGRGTCSCLNLCTTSIIKWLKRKVKYSNFQWLILGNLSLMRFWCFCSYSKNMPKTAAIPLSVIAPIYLVYDFIALLGIFLETNITMSWELGFPLQ